MYLADGKIESLVVVLKFKSGAFFCVASSQICSASLTIEHVRSVFVVFQQTQYMNRLRCMHAEMYDIEYCLVYIRYTIVMNGFTRILQLLNDSNSSSNALWLPIFIVFRQSMPKFSELNNGILIKSLSAINDPSTQNGRSSGVFKIAPFYTHFNFERKSA